MTDQCKALAEWKDEGSAEGRRKKEEEREREKRAEKEVLYT